MDPKHVKLEHFRAAPSDSWYTLMRRYLYATLTQSRRSQAGVTVAAPISDDGSGGTRKHGVLACKCATGTS